MVDRTPRTAESREVGQRRKTWSRQALLPTPEPRDGLKFRWIRTSSLGNADLTNVSARFREGYTPVKAADFPELKIMSDVGSRFKDGIEVGGLLLCSVPVEMAKERELGQEEMARAQIASVDQNYMRQSDPRMPVLAPERSSKVSFGR